MLPVGIPLHPSIYLLEEWDHDERKDDSKEKSFEREQEATERTTTPYDIPG